MSDRERLNPLFSIAPLVAHLEAGHPVITSNLRLSRKIREAWQMDRCRRQLDTWEEPAILPLESWLENCWLQLLDAGFEPALAGACITPHQETLLWQQVVREADNLPDTANPDNFADLARRGWKLVKQWRIDGESLDNSFHTGARSLHRWGTTFDETLARQSLISPEQRAEIVLRGFEERALPRAPAMVLAGFQTLPPLSETILEAATENLIVHRPTETPGTCFRAAADDLPREIATAARWAKDRLAEHPGARIGIVVPRLTAIQKQVERLFCNTLEPERILPATGYGPTPYNISAARPLAETPVVDAALNLLSLLTERITLDTCCGLLTTPFWGNADEETTLRCAVETELRSLGLHEFPPSRLRLVCHRFEADEGGTVADGALSCRLARLATLQRETPAKQGFGQWRETLARALAILGWPGERSPDSLEYQQLEHWRELLETLADLERVAPPVTTEEVLRQLGGLARDTPFHAETPDRRIQILGTLEGAGLRFDHLWVMNMEDRQWPEPIAPHPLLPVDLQRREGMPRSSPERELALSRELFALFCRSAGEVVFSHSQREGDVGLKPSLFLEGLPEYPTESIETFHAWWAPIHDNRRLEVVADGRGPAHIPADGRLGRGSRFISDQAQCPFNAFARWRLGADAPEEPQSGLGPLRRGILVHDALESFWRLTRDSRTLEELAAEEKTRRLEQAVDEAMAGIFRRRGGLVVEADFGHRYLTLERRRLVRLLETWLALELERPAFTVEHLELNTELTLAGYTLGLRLDRVDRLGDGGLAIIDYKTGQAGIGAVTGERLLEAQLPLYSLALEETAGEMPAAVAYARINTRNPGIDGLAATEGLLPGCRALEEKGLPDTWADTLGQWREALEALLAEIRDGRADVTFHSRDAQTYSADLLPLNRWPERERLDRLEVTVPGSQGVQP